MGNLTDSAKDSFNKASKRAYVPEWWGVASIVLLVIIGVVAVSNMIFSGGAPEPAPQAGVQATSGVNSGEDEETPADNDGTSTEPTTAPTEEVPSGDAGAIVNMTNMTNAQGETVSVPSGVLEQAKLAAVALYSGDFAGVQLPTGAAVPTGGNDSSAALQDIVVTSTSEISYDFTATITTGDGEQRTTPVTIMLDGDFWVYQP